MKFDLLSALIGFLVAVVLFLIRSRMTSRYDVPSFSGQSQMELQSSYESELKGLSDDLMKKMESSPPEEHEKINAEFAASQQALTDAYSAAMMALAPPVPTQSG